MRRAVVLQDLLSQILGHGGINVWYQPIFELDGQNGGNPKLFAIEAFSRGPKGSNAERPDVLFEYVRRKAKEVEVDRACIKAILTALYAVGRCSRLSINVHALTLERDERFTDYIVEICNQFRVAPGRLILEVVEQQKYRDAPRFFRHLDKLRAAGVQIAVDDVGLGYSNYRALLEIRPDLYKIDRYFIDRCAERDHARAAIESMVLLAGKLGGRVIAEGVERADDLRTVASLGVNLVQGFHLAPPQSVDTLHGMNPQNGKENYE